MIIREAEPRDVAAIFALFQRAAVSGTLGRDPDEYSETDVSAELVGAFAEGIVLVAILDDRLVGMVKGSRLAARRFRHVYGKLTVAVLPDHQGRGIGRGLLEHLIHRIDALVPVVTRIELTLQAGNPGALRLYSSLGFVEEGRQRCRVGKDDGSFADDIIMGRLR